MPASKFNLTKKRGPFQLPFMELSSQGVPLMITHMLVFAAVAFFPLDDMKHVRFFDVCVEAVKRKQFPTSPSVVGLSIIILDN